MKCFQKGSLNDMQTGFSCLIKEVQDVSKKDVLGNSIYYNYENGNSSTSFLHEFPLTAVRKDLNITWEDCIIHGI